MADNIPTEGSTNAAANVYTCTKNSAVSPYVFSDYVIGQRKFRTYGGPGYTFGLGDFVSATSLRSPGTGFMLRLQAPASGAVTAKVHSIRVRLHYFKNRSAIADAAIIPDRYPNGLAAVTISPITGTQIAVGRFGLVLRSTDNGVNWATVSTSFSYDLLAVSHKGTDSKTFVTTGQSGVVYESTDDGVTWVSVFSPMNTALHSVRYASRVGFVFTGEAKMSVRSAPSLINWVVSDGDAALSWTV